MYFTLSRGGQHKRGNTSKHGGAPKTIKQGRILQNVKKSIATSLSLSLPYIPVQFLFHIWSLMPVLCLYSSYFFFCIFINSFCICCVKLMMPLSAALFSLLSLHQTHINHKGKTPLMVSLGKISNYICHPIRLVSPVFCLICLNNYSKIIQIIAGRYPIRGTPLGWPPRCPQVSQSSGKIAKNPKNLISPKY